MFAEKKEALSHGKSRPMVLMSSMGLHCPMGNAPKENVRHQIRHLVRVIAKEWQRANKTPFLSPNDTFILGILPLSCTFACGCFTPTAPQTDFRLNYTFPSSHYTFLNTPSCLYTAPLHVATNNKSVYLMFFIWKFCPLTCMCRSKKQRAALMAQLD